MPALRDEYPETGVLLDEMQQPLRDDIDDSGGGVPGLNAIFGSKPWNGPTINGARVADDVDLLGSLIRDFEEAENQSVDSRRLSQRDRDMRDGIQWTAAEVAELEKRGQPVVWNNIIGRKVDLLRGLERRGRSDPKAYPRTPVEDSRADAATQALRYIADQNRFDVVRSAVFDNMLVEGTGGAEVIVEPVQSKRSLMATTALTQPQTDYDIVINSVPWDRLFWDPHSQHLGFSDARYVGMVIWMDRAEALERYPGCDDIIETTFNGYRYDTYDDKPQTMWSDSRRRRVRVVQEWFKRGRDWWTATFTRGGFLEAPMVSPYLDRHGDGHCTLIMRSGKIDRENNRFGVVRDMVPIQEEVNKRRSKLLWSLNVNRIEMEEGAVADVDEARRQVARPDGLIIKNRGFEFAVNKDQAEVAGQFQLLQDAYHQMDLAGPNAAMSGKDPRELSGRAILAFQSGGMLEHEAMADELRQWTHKIFEAAWMAVRQFWTNERWIRVTDSDRNVKFVGLNRQVTLMDLLNDLDKATPLTQQLMALPPDEARAVQFGLRLQPGDPRLGMVVKVENDVGDMDVDITVEEGPDNPTLQAEQFQAIMQMPPQFLMQIPIEVIFKASSLRDKDELLQLIEQHKQEQAQQAQKADAIKTAMATAQIDEKRASAADKQASAALKVHDMALDHAEAQHTPLVPGVGPVAPEINPLLQPQPALPVQGA